MQILLKYALLFSSFAILMSVGVDLEKYYKLSHSGIMAEATVTGKICNIHDEVKYDFIVGQRNFAGIGHADDCKTIKVADKIKIYYLGSDPSVNSVSDPKDELVDCIVGILTVSSLFPIILMLISRRKGSSG